MDIGAIAIQPDPLSLQAAYRPIFFKVYADSLVGPEQPMYADIYFTYYLWGVSYIYYKTITSFSTTNVGGTNSVFDFDIQDACQEVLSTDLLTVTVNNEIPATSGFVGAYVYFRGSTYVSGVLIPNATVPTQGTVTTTPISTFSGTQSNTFWVLNATLKPDNINDALNGLNSPETILQASLNFVPPLTDQRIYPLTNLPTNNIFTPNTAICPTVYASDHGALPVLILQFGAFGGLPIDSRTCTLYLEMLVNGGPSSTNINLLTNVGIGLGVTYFPCGMQEIALLAPSVIPTMLDPANSIYYRIVLVDTDAAKICFYSPMYKVRNKGVENKRLWFQNYWGHWEQLSFSRNSEKFTTVSNEQFKPYLTESFTGIYPNVTGRKRYNVRVQDEETLIGIFPEALMPWIKELLGSPFVLMDSPNLAQFPFYPVNLPAFKVQDDTFSTRKTVIDGRINYEVTVKLPPSLDYITLRN